VREYRCKERRGRFTLDFTAHIRGDAEWMAARGTYGASVIGLHIVGLRARPCGFINEVALMLMHVTGI
jgi:hypothetical protein